MPYKWRATTTVGSSGWATGFARAWEGHEAVHADITLCATITTHGYFLMFFSSARLARHLYAVVEIPSSI